MSNGGDTPTKVVDTGIRFHDCKILIVAEEWIARGCACHLRELSPGLTLGSGPPDLSVVKVLTAHKLEQLAGRLLFSDPKQRDKGHTQGELDKAVDRLSKLSKSEPTICVKCENYVGPSLKALRGCPDAVLSGPARCVLHLDDTLDPITGDRKRAKAIECSSRNPGGKCEHYSPKGERTTK